MNDSVTQGTPVPAAGRQYFIDNLRWLMICLVLGMHAADTYSPFGNWYYGDKAQSGMATAVVLGTYQSVVQSFFMGLLFAIAGYYARTSLLKKGRMRFALDRLFRLGVPVLLFMLVIGPVTEYFVAHSWRPSPPTSFAYEWWHHIADGEVFSESGPLWFCLALLLFSLLYAFTSRRRPLAQADSSHITGGQIAAFVALMTMSTFSVRLVFPESASWLNLHLGDFPQYALMFAAGVHIRATDWIETRPSWHGPLLVGGGLTVGLIAWGLLLYFGGALSGQFSHYDGGLNWVSAAKCLWESCLCVALSTGLLIVYRDRANVSNAVVRFLSENAFAVYAFHPPLLILVTLLLTHTSWPPLIKALMATLGGIVVSYLFSALIARRIPGLRRIL